MDIKCKPKQECTRCVSIGKCWATVTNTGHPVSSSNVLININICRLQMGIERDKAVKNLLKILRPGMIRLISYVKQTGAIPGIDMEQLLNDMQSVAIEYLLYDYKIGDRGRATPYLFDPNQGFLIKWVKWMTGKNRRFYSHHELHDPNESYTDEEEDAHHHQAQWTTQSDTHNSWDSITQGSIQSKYDLYASTDKEIDMSGSIMDIINDGMTLNSNEYRVMLYCLTNSNESNNTRHIDGLHISLAKLMNVSRPRITRLYRRGQDKLRRRYAQIKDRE
jgi:hypothetical protein